MKRRDFIKNSLLFTSSLSIVGNKVFSSNSNSIVYKVEGNSPYLITKGLIERMGGMKRFISKNDIVMIKPNIAWNRSVEYAANTNPEVLKAIIEEVFNAGAKKVIVMDNTCHNAELSYKKSGIQNLAKQMGAEVRFVDDKRLGLYNFKGEFVKKYPVYRDFLEVDKFINVPILKHHGLSGLTIAMKNLYGVLGGRRGKLHRKIHKSIADISYGFKNDLIIVDAFRILKNHGPVGGNLSDVEMKKTVIGATNIMEADVVAANIFGKEPKTIGFLREGYKRGIGEIDLNKIVVKEFRV